MNSPIFVIYRTNKLWTLKAGAIAEPIETSIAGIQVRIHFPAIESDKFFGFYLENPIVANELIEKQRVGAQQFEHWGEVTNFQTEPLLANEVEVAQLVIEITDAKIITEDINTWAHQKLTMWRNLVTSWIEYLGNQVCDVGARNVQNLTNDNIVCLLPEPDGAYSRTSSIQVKIGTARGSEAWGNAVSTTQLNHALVKAAESEEVPIVKKFLSSAKTRILLTEFRNSILDASIAVEDSIITRLIQISGSDVYLSSSGSIKKYTRQSLGTILKLLNNVSGGLPISDLDGFTSLRNLAAHKVVEINQHQAEEFLRESKLIIDFCQS
jgi:hypothetical protein